MYIFPVSNVISFEMPSNIRFFSSHHGMFLNNRIELDPKWTYFALDSHGMPRLMLNKPEWVKETPYFDKWKDAELAKKEFFDICGLDPDLYVVGRVYPLACKDDSAVRLEVKLDDYRSILAELQLTEDKRRIARVMESSN